MKGARHLPPVAVRFAFRPVDPDADAELLHRWVTHPKARFWLMQDADVAAVRAEYVQIAASAHHDAAIGLADGEPAVLAERYDPAHAPVGDAYDVQEGDLGMHVLVAPTDTPVHGFTRTAMRAVMAWCFEDPAVARVVVEPDAENTAIHRLNAAVGFRELRVVQLPDKRALLSVCTRTAFEEATR
ncbi:GNAT family N-acetyltransferase [Conexibacter sp. SYSU D00693]|uniref:GNAT family N-acetyltransferase n=1 Tax=Conexibacter sp. SYSU D00693 TaxID=2812560 RepID=UPI00196BA2CA|nr:GNAT family N-acetyltransferase [Conexibacter sp. SYSU D00693]